MRTKRVLSSRGCCRIWVNFVNKAVMQPIKLPTRKLAQNMPKKSRIACMISTFNHIHHSRIEP